MVLLFLLDLVAKVPFGGGPFTIVDILGLLASGDRRLPRLNASRT